MVTSLPSTRKWSPHHFCAQAHMKTHILSPRCPWPLFGASWVLPGCLLGVSWIPRRLKIAQKHKIPQHQHKIHVPKIQGRVLFEVVEAPQASATQTHRAGRPLGHDGTSQIYNHLENNIFLNKWDLTCKTQVNSDCLQKN